MLGSLLCLLDRHHARACCSAAPPAALVAYFVSSCCCPTCPASWPPARTGYAKLQPWVDLTYAQSYLFEGMLTGAQWAHVATAATLWIVLPGIFGLRRVMRAEVK